jgi:hypothetical protein
MLNAKYFFVKPAIQKISGFTNSSKMGAFLPPSKWGAAPAG